MPGYNRWMTTSGNGIMSKLCHSIRRVGARAAFLAALFGALDIGGIAHASAQEKYVQPNEHLTVDGIPPISTATAERVARYTDFRPRALVDWHPVQRTMLVSTRTKGTTVQLHLLKKPMGELEQLTDFPDPVRNARFEPHTGSYIVFEKDEGGSEASQLYRLDLDTRKVTLLTHPDEKHALGEWNHAGSLIAMTSTQLDKTAGPGRRTDVTTDLALLDPLHPDAKKNIASLPGGGWGDFRWSPDDRKLLALNYKSANESSVWLIDIATGERKQILPVGEPVADAPVFYGDIRFTRDGKSILAVTDRDGEFHELTKIDLKTLKHVPLSRHIPWNVGNVEPSKRSDRVAAVVNNDGSYDLHLFDAGNGRELPRLKLPAGGVTHVWWRNADELGFALDSARSPGEVYSVNVKSGKVEQWTRPEAGIDTNAFSDSAIIRWKSFDGRTISGLITKPPAQFKGPRPVIVLIHGGPESQTTLGFLGRYNYLINELGITLIEPNVRGSAGYGKTFLKLDNGYLREDSVKDIGALFDWIAGQPDLDAKRVMVMGGSYGGYMSLAVATHYADRIVGNVDVVGISNFISFLERTESYRRDLRRVEYGDERDPKMREFLTRISPLNNADRIRKPMLVVQGKNDPRVPLFEAEQIVERVRGNGTPVWYLMADNEGHGFARKPNADFYFFSVVRFAEEYLLK
jgi:dipeptidyl aminopeptidase/acylaminoacyl peptidase